MKNKIIDTANKSGITEIGFVNAHEFSKKQIYSSSQFAKSELMTDVFSVMSDAKTVIVYLVPYKSECTPVNLSNYAVGEDYHKVCGRLSEPILNLLKENGYKGVSLTDDNPLCERELAKDAGLGFIGKNRFLINEKYGSYVFISCIVTDCMIEKTLPLYMKCHECGKCIESCPGKALTVSGFDETKCVSFLTQKKGELSEKEKNIIRRAGNVWGCDICQSICPENTGKKLTNINSFKNNLILCIKNEELSNREFKRKYSDRAFSWRGKAVIDRNLSIFDEKE